MGIYFGRLLSNFPLKSYLYGLTVVDLRTNLIVGLFTLLV